MNAYWKARLGVSLVFVIGCVAGALITAIILHHRTALFFQKPNALMEVLEHRLTRNLHLNPDQRAQVHDALMVNVGQRKLLQAQIRPQIKALNQQTVQQIESILTPDQLTIFNRNLDDLHRLRVFPTPAPDASIPSSAATSLPVSSPPSAGH